MSSTTDTDRSPAAPGNEHVDFTGRAARIAPLVDGVEYLRWLRRALIAARDQVWVLGWDFHSEIDLLRGEEAERAEEEDGWPVRLADLLQRLVDEREGLEVRILIWEGSSLFALERQHLPRMKRPWSKSPRLQLEWDRGAPPLGSFHEKFVVVDDRVAFVGGMDLTRSRWDDHEHAPHDERRRNPGLWPSYGVPYHEVQLAVDGEAAQRLGDWARVRWRRSLDEEVAAPEVPDDAPDPWPEGLEPALRDRDVFFVRTQPASDGQDEVRQIERSYLDQVRAARSLVFAETQYLAHGEIVDALCERLREHDGPEVVIVLPYGCPGALQSRAMDTRRDELLDRLREADPGGRLSVTWPTLAGGAEEDVYEHSVYVHAKVAVFDDRVLRIGSSNWNNRSMGLDQELDAIVAVDADDEDGVAAVRRFRQRLLAYFLHVEPEAVAEAERGPGSVVAAIESLRGGERTLHPFEHRAAASQDDLVLPIELSDPSHPLREEDAQRVLDAIAEQADFPGRARRVFAVVAGSARHWKGPLLAVVAIALAVVLWRATPLSEWVGVESVSGALDRLGAGPLGLGAVVGLFALIGASGFPVTVLVASIGATLPPFQGVLVCVPGIALSSMIGFGVGRLLRRRTATRPDSGGRLRGAARRVGERFAGRGVLAVALLRNLPIAPYALVNVACGTTRLRWWTYLAGTLIGTLPGVVLLCVFGRQVGDLVAEPTWTRAAQAVVALALVVAAALGTDRLLRRWSHGEGED